MSSARAWRARGMPYFWWLVFSTALFLAPPALALPNIVEVYHFAWLDTLATFALAFNVIALSVALPGAGVLGGLEAVMARSKLWLVRALPRLVMFTLFLAVWLRVLRGLLRVYKVEFVPVERPWEVWGAVLLMVVLVLLVRRRIAAWVDQMTAQVRAVSIGLLLLTLPLSAYLALEPLRHGAPPPVTLAAPEQPRPNVVVIVLDGLTSRDMSLYGYHLPTTPNLERLTKRWTVFENAHSIGTGTVAVQPAILTGRYPYYDQWHRYGDLAHAGQGVLNLAQVLEAAGYQTIYGMGGGWWPGRYHLHHAFDRILGGGYPVTVRPNNPVHTFPGRDLLNRTVWNPTVAEALLLRHYGGIGGAATTVSEPLYATATHLLHDQARSTLPFFMYLHMSRPHHPWLGNEFLGTFLPVEEGLANVGSQMRLTFRNYPPDQQPAYDRLRLRYNENILKADQQVGALIDTLQQLDLYDQSLIVITADHGENYTGGYHGYFTPRLAAAEHSIPLLVKFPGQTEGRRVSTAVSNVDILPTVLDVVDATYPQDWVDGQSLLRAEHDPHRIVYVSRMLLSEASVDYNTVAAISGDLKLVRRQGKTFLYNLADDPEEQVNLLGRMPASALQRALDEFSHRQHFVRAGGDIIQAPDVIGSTAEPQAAN